MTISTTSRGTGGAVCALTLAQAINARNKHRNDATGTLVMPALFSSLYDVFFFIFWDIRDTLYVGEYCYTFLSESTFIRCHVKWLSERTNKINAKGTMTKLNCWGRKAKEIINNAKTNKFSGW
jgi:hypothetical protein